MKRIVFGTLRRRRFRTLLVWLSTLIAFMLLGFFLAIRHGFAVGPVQVGADLLLLEPAGGTSGLPVGSLSTIGAFPGVRSVVGIDATGMRYGTDRHPVVVEGLSPHAFLELSGVVQLGELAGPAAQTWLTDPTGALVSEKAAHKYNWRVGQTFILHTMGGGPPRDLTVHVDGVLAKHKGVSPTGDVNLHLDHFRRWAHSDAVDFMFIQVKRAGQADAVAQAIQLRFANSTTPVTTQSFKSLLQGMAERLADVNALTSVVIVASLFGLFLICFNTLIHSVSELFRPAQLRKPLRRPAWHARMVCRSLRRTFWAAFRCSTGIGSSRHGLHCGGYHPLCSPSTKDWALCKAGGFEQAWTRSWWARRRRAVSEDSRWAAGWLPKARSGPWWGYSPPARSSFPLKRGPARGEPAL